MDISPVLYINDLAQKIENQRVADKKETCKQITDAQEEYEQEIHDILGTDYFE